MKLHSSYLLLLFCFLFNGALIAQKAINIDVSTSNDKMIIAYDLDGKSAEVYDVELVFKTDDGSVIRPKSIKGDYGKVEAGDGKAIIWEVYKDYDELSGKMDPIILVKEIPKKKEPVVTQPTPKPPAPTVDPNNKNKKGKNPTDLFDELFKEYRFGFKVGLGNSSVESNRRPKDFDQAFSYQTGLFFRWNAARRFFVQPEVLYHQHLYEENFSLDTIPGQYSQNRNHYLRGQLLVGVAPFGAGIHFNAGLYYGYLMGGKEKVFLANETSESTHFSVPSNNGLETPYRKSDAGYMVGGSMNFFKGAFAMGVLYSKGFDSYIDSQYFENVADYENWKKVNQSFHFFITKSF